MKYYRGAWDDNPNDYFWDFMTQSGYRQKMILKGWLILGILVLLSISRVGFPQAVEKNPFKVEVKASSSQLQPGGVFTLSAQFLIPSSHYLYDDKTSVLFENSADLTILKTERPGAVLHQDPFSKKEAAVYLESFEQKTYLQIPPKTSLGKRSLEVTVRYQGCSEDFCYRPIRKTYLVPIEIVSVPSTISAAREVIHEKGEQEGITTRIPFWDLIHESNPERLLNQGKIIVLALAFVGGVLTSLTPCVLPIIPLTLAFIGVRPRQKGNLLKVFYLVMGMVLVYSVLGFTAASLGLRLGFLFQNRFFVLLTALLFLGFALILFDLVPFQLPHRLQQLVHRIGGESPWGNFFAGATIGLIASPCVGPLIAPLLLIAAREQDRFYGFFLLFNYGLGMGVLFFLLGSFFLSAINQLKGRYWTRVLKKGLGVVMLLPAIYYGGVFGKSFFEWKHPNFWIHNLKEGFSIAEQTKKPIVLDFYADWCPPCIELDKRTFSTPEVQAKANHFVMIQLNCTVDNDQCREATKKYQVVGWPTVLFLNSQGETLKDLKFVGGFVDKNKMLDFMEKALSETTQKHDTPTP